MTTSFTFDPARGFGVYVHWPYCTRICPYCDFNVYAAKTRDPAPLVSAILADLSYWRERTGPRSVDSMFLGGGTPSLLPPQDVVRLIDAIDRLWGVREGAEISLEANPEDADRLPALAAAGVNRLSLGVQSLRDAQLAFLGRTHSARDALAAIEIARNAFASVSLDLIYALPDQSIADWEGELGEALALKPDHLSLYELTIEPGAAFARSVKRGAWTPADDERAASLYEMTQTMTEEAGLPAYEISNHARRPDHRSQHNMVYWRSGDWAGVGPGAHGRLTADGVRRAVETDMSPTAYIERVAATGSSWVADDELDALAQARERVAMGLRLAGGFDADDITDLGLSLDESRINELVAQDLLRRSATTIALTPAGRLLADRIAQEIAP